MLQILLYKYWCFLEDGFCIIFNRIKSIPTPIQLQNNNCFIYTVYELRNDFTALMVTKLQLHINVFFQSDIEANLNKTKKINWQTSQQIIKKAKCSQESLTANMFRIFQIYLIQCSPIQMQYWSCRYFKHDIHKISNWSNKEFKDSPKP